MTHLASLVVFRGLVSEYWHEQIQTSASAHNHWNSFSFLSHTLTLNYAKVFITLYPFT